MILGLAFTSRRKTVTCELQLPGVLAMVFLETPLLAQTGDGTATGEMNMIDMTPASMYLMNNASGTSVNPPSWPMPMVMTHFGSWNSMLMGVGFIVDTQQSGPRGGDKLYSPNWFMASFEHKLGNAGALQFDLMLSLDPATITGERYPPAVSNGRDCLWKAASRCSASAQLHHGPWPPLCSRTRQGHDNGAIRRVDRRSSTQTDRLSSSRLCHGISGSADYSLPNAIKPHHGNHPIGGTDTLCGAQHNMKGHSNAECAKMCANASGQYALFDGRKVLKLSDQKTPAKYAAQKVKVTGTLDPKTNDQSFVG
jgi:hypothetical protein